MISKIKNKWWVLPALAVISIILTIVVSYSRPFQQLDLAITDQLFELRGPIAIEDTSIVLVSISQQADSEIPYKYPWPTHYYAKLIENLNKAGAKAIGIDVIFDKRDQYNPANDSIFAEALNKYENVVLAGRISSSLKQRGGGSQSQSQEIVGPNNLLSEANPNQMGLVSVVNDIDDGVRRYLLHREYGEKTYYSLGLELLSIYNDIEKTEIQTQDDFFSLGDYRIPKYNQNTMVINYFGGPGIFATYSFETVIDDSTVLLESEDESFQLNQFSDPDFGLLKEGVFKDKIVLVGATMPELHDFHPTPFALSRTMPGYETHANAIKTILTGNYIHYASPLINLLLLSLAVVIIIFITRKTNGIWGFLAFVFLSSASVGLVIFEFINFGYILKATSPMVALVVGYLGTLSYEYFAEQREKQRIRGMFSSYVSPRLVNKMIESGQDPQLGGDESYITAFFSDIQSFSTFSEKLEAVKLVELINEYLSAMTEILTDQGGTLDKYIGDAIVAFFGAPLPQEDHAYRACVVSQLMQKRLDELREKWKEEGEQWPEIVQHMRSRIGLNTGNMVTGNMGSTSRFNYTMMGDNVNLAARCESGAKSFGVYTMVTADTKNEAEQYGDRCIFRYLDKIVVKGRTQPVEVYEIMGLKEDITDQQLECKSVFEDGTEAYQNQHWDKAIRLFEQSAKLETFKPNSGNPLISTNPSLVYIDRCKQMKANPPEADWDGVFVMTSK
ncbi:MAG: adenylate/guanylate cyclase domain-containing protein [Balneolaceae bacterium]|nr:adenylate/guanylate cyclase domain-containing protein [Balneolaceae bacterium]